MHEIKGTPRYRKHYLIPTEAQTDSLKGSPYLYFLLNTASLFVVSPPPTILHSHFFYCRSPCCLSLSHFICLLLSYTVLSSLFPLAIPRPAVQPVGLNNTDKRWKNRQRELRRDRKWEMGEWRQLHSSTLFPLRLPPWQIVPRGPCSTLA